MAIVKRFNSWLARHPAQTDGLLAGGLFGLVLLEAWLNLDIAPESFQGPAWWKIWVLAPLITLPLAWRRRLPLAVLLPVTPAFIVADWASIPVSSAGGIAMFIAILSAGAYGNGRWRTPTRAAALGALYGYLAYQVGFADFDSVGASVFGLRAFIILFNVFFFISAFVLGEVMWNSRANAEQLKDRTDQLEREREENARRAVIEERVRIARELHDVVAHHVSVMGVQAGAARKVLQRAPEKALEALASIEASSRQAVAELQRLLGFLRQEGEQDTVAPQPDTSQIGKLVEQVRQAGLAVEMHVEGERRSLPPSVDLSAYRIVQEALTNTLKHAGPATASLTIRYGPESIDIEVIDNGKGSSELSGAAGNGLIGIRERVGLLGGQLEAGPRASGGFAVKATLPFKGRLT